MSLAEVVSCRSSTVALGQEQESSVSWAKKTGREMAVAWVAHGRGLHRRGAMRRAMGLGPRPRWWFSEREVAIKFIAGEHALDATTVGAFSAKVEPRRSWPSQRRCDLPCRCCRLKALPGDGICAAARWTSWSPRTGPCLGPGCCTLRWTLRAASRLPTCGGLFTVM